MPKLDPVYYTYEADVHCPDCAKKRFGRCKEHNQIACCVTDNEGNEPGTAFSYSDTVCGEWCADCGDEIIEHPETDGEECDSCGQIID